MTAHVAHPVDLLQMVGEPLGTTSWVTVDQAMIDAFADATGDHQWIHVDPERAATGPFGTTIAHGYLTLALAARFLGELLEVDNVAMKVNYGLNKVRFPAPVPAGSRVRAHGALTGARTKGLGIETAITLTYEVEGAQRAPCVAEAVVIIQPADGESTESGSEA